MPRKHSETTPVYKTSWDDPRRFEDTSTPVITKPKKPSKFKTFMKAVGVVIVTDAIIKSIRKED